MYTYVLTITTITIIIIIITIITIIIRGLLVGGGFLWTFALLIPTTTRDNEKKKKRVHSPLLFKSLVIKLVDYEQHVVLSRNNREYQLVE